MANKAIIIRTKTGFRITLTHNNILLTEYTTTKLSSVIDAIETLEG